MYKLIHGSIIKNAMYFPINLPNRILTEEELFNFCRLNPMLRIERDSFGNLFFRLPTGLISSTQRSFLCYSLNNWNRQTKLGRVSESNGGYTLPDGSMRAPDVAWISHERLATVSPEDLKKFAHVCPDFVLELASESDEVRELKGKMDKWLANGVRLGWLVDLSSRKTTIYRPDRQPEEKAFSEVLSGEDVLPGFELNLSSLEEEAAQ